MMKQEFDEIAKKFGYSSVDPEVYDKEIEPVYMTFCDLLGDTAKEDVVRCFWGHENTTEYNMWNILRWKKNELDLVRTARKHTEDVFLMGGFKSAHAKILQGFWDARNEILCFVSHLIAEWRKGQKRG